MKRFRNEKFDVDPDFMPLRLLWSHWRERRYEIPIPPGAYRHCDLGFVIEPTAQGIHVPPVENGALLCWFDVFLRPNTGRTSLLPGGYRIVLSAFGRNVKPASLEIELEWNGGWKDDIDALLREELLLRKGFESA